MSFRFNLNEFRRSIAFSSSFKGFIVFSLSLSPFFLSSFDALFSVNSRMTFVYERDVRPIKIFESNHF